MLSFKTPEENNSNQMLHKGQFSVSFCGVCGGGGVCVYDCENIAQTLI